MCKLWRTGLHNSQILRLSWSKEVWQVTEIDPKNGHRRKPQLPQTASREPQPPQTANPANRNSRKPQTPQTAIAANPANRKNRQPQTPQIANTVHRKP